MQTDGDMRYYRYSCGVCRHVNTKFVDSWML